ncbi:MULTISPECIES: DsbA family protein [unclassified Nocardioides]|uniref:DsbA family protein n=1 Tax=unclassified Nocardioides TaxID=2615069 RepID=UPI0009EFF294|nr:MULTISPECIES: thioredoxin domain-containing protein [unclassified Nocardioides]GAW52264.1 DSBA oxidoreductase [Nocardioides sp. PD653-B2]GAW56051.1 DSBA oxidoreductase [Nocardioides sp. PD653]
MSKKNRETDRAARAAAAMAEQHRQEARRRNVMVGGVVLAILVVVAVGYFISRSLDTTTDVSAPAAGSEFGLTIGPDDAPHEVIIYEDFLCPFCGELEAASRDDLSQLAADGKVQVEYRPFDLLTQAGDYSARSAGAFSIVLDKAGADVAKKFHDLLYENQPSEAGPFPDNAALVDLAVQAGATEADVKGPIEDEDGAGWADRATKAADEAGVSGTPTVLLDGKVFTDYSNMQDLASNLVEQLQ